MPDNFTYERPSFTQEADFRQQRDFSQKVSVTFDFIGVHWRGLGRVLLYLVVPMALLRGILGGLLQSEYLRTFLHSASQTTHSYNGVWSLYGNLFSSPAYYGGGLLSYAFNTLLVLSVYGYLLECLSPSGAPGAPITVGAVGRIVARRFVGTFFSTIGLTIAIVLGFFVLCVPGVYLSVVFSLFFIVQLVEGTGFGATINRCTTLVKGKWWSTAGLIFIMLVFLYIISIGIGLSSNLLRGSLHELFAFSLFSPIFSIVYTTLASLLTLLFYVPLLIALAFQYFNLVERKEGVGMYRLIDQLGQAAPAGPAADTYRPVEEGEY